MLHITYFIILHYTSTSQLSFSSALAQLCSASPKLVKPVQLCVKTGDSLLPSLSGARLICRLTGLTSPAMCRSINCFWAGASLTYHRCWSPKVRNIFPQHTHTYTREFAELHQLLQHKSYQITFSSFPESALQKLVCAPRHCLDQSKQGQKVINHVLSCNIQAVETMIDM